MNRYESTVRIPIVIKNGRPVPRDGASFPEFREGALGELVMPAESLKKKQERATLNAQEVVDLFPAGTFLRVAVDPRERLPAPLGKYLIDTPGTGRPCVVVELREELRLILRGTKKAALSSCECFIPGLSTEAASLNHACTLVSTAFEPWRVSHVGNAFNDVYFENGGRWWPLRVQRGER